MNLAKTQRKHHTQSAQAQVQIQYQDHNQNQNQDQIQAQIPIQIQAPVIESSSQKLNLSSNPMRGNNNMQFATRN